MSKPKVSFQPPRPPSPSLPPACPPCSRSHAPAVPAFIQAPSAILPLPGQSVEQLCMDPRHRQGPVNLLSDPEQGETGTARETQTPLAHTHHLPTETHPPPAHRDTQHAQT
ncbi:hypothetical protein P7K49_030564 [Saguinus oedipus]|uniref:Uncharacterized protein n=1 Tax=Saguinus oedipus TaxID=9490 RepID=A0ABQ9U2H9_SAGOE|nr:hypothetical protein P7K49_030564 [Saguinus oedipus]